MMISNLSTESYDDKQLQYRMMISNFMNETYDG